MSVKISNSSRPKVSEGLKWIKANSTTGSDGSVTTKFDAVHYFTAKEIIVRYTKLQRSIPETTHRRAVNLAIKRWLSHKEYCEDGDMVSAFLKALEVEISQLEEDRKIFNVLMFLNVDKSLREFEPISILGDKLAVRTWNDLSTLRMDDLWKEISSMDRSNPIFLRLPIGNAPLPRSSDFAPVILSIKSWGSLDAATIANDRFDILRAILNMSALRGTLTFRSEPKQLAVFLPTPVLGVFDSNGNLVGPYRTIEKFAYDDYRKSTLKDTWLPTIKNLLGFFDHELKYPSADHHVLGLLRLYQTAIDVSSTRSAFLGMWQVLESAVTFGQENDVKQRVVVSRVSTLVGKEFKLALELFAEMRNELVHNGEFREEGDDLLPTLKLIADICIGRLVGLSRELTTVHELRDWIKYLTLGDSELARKTKVISSIQKHRERKQVTTSGTN